MKFLPAFFSAALLGTLPQMNVAWAQNADAGSRQRSSENGSEALKNESDPASGRGNMILVQGAVLKTVESTAVPAAIEGIIQRLEVREGDIVSSDQRLCSLNETTIRIELERVEARVQIAKAKQASDINLRLAVKAKQVADNEYQRALNANALAPDTYPRNEIDRLKLVADKAALEVERAKYEQRIAELELNVAIGDYRQSYDLFERHRIKAPVSGVVVAVEKRVGEWVEPGTEILRIVRIDRLRVEGFVSADQAELSLVGNKAEVWRDEKRDAKPIVGRVSFVSPDANTINSQVRIYIDVENESGRLRPGLPVEARIDVTEHE